MGKSGRQAITGKRLASLHLGSPLEGVSKVQTAKLNETRIAEASEDTKSSDRPSAFTLRYVTPKTRRATLAHHEAKRVTTLTDSTTLVSPPSNAIVGDGPQGSIGNAPPQKRMRRDERGGSDDLYNTSHDEGEAPKAWPIYDAAAGAGELPSAPHSSDRVRQADRREQEDPRIHWPASSIDHLDGNADQTMGLRSSSHLDSGTRAAKTDYPGRPREFATESATVPTRVPTLTRSRNSSTESDDLWPNQSSIPTSPMHLERSVSKKPEDAHHNQAERRSTTEDVVVGDQSALRIEPTTGGFVTKTSIGVSESTPAPDDPAGLSSIRAPSLSFKAKKLRGKFDASAIETRFGIQLSTEEENKLRALSGNNMGAAINIYLQGPHKSSGNDGAEASGQRKMSSSSSISFWQQKRQSEKQKQNPHPEAPKRKRGQESISSEDRKSIVDVSDPAFAERGQENVDLPLSRPGTSAIASQSHVAAGDLWPLVGHRSSSEEVVARNKALERCCTDDSGSMENVQVESVGGHCGLAVDAVHSTTSEIAEANEMSDNSGAGSVPLRGMQGFTNQENVRPRNPPPSSANRLPNGKLGAGSGSGWGAFGMAMGGAPGLPTMQQRNMAGTGGMGSFAQNLGGSQPATPLDPSEFPSLSAGPQTPQQNPGQAIWAQRPVPQTPAPNQRQQSSQASQPNPLQNQQQSQPAHEDMFPAAAAAAAASHFATGLGDYGQGNPAVPGSIQPQTGSIDEFPPLGRESSSGQGHERRGSLMQNNAFGGYGAGMAFAGMTQQQRSLMSNALDRERMESPASSGMGFSSSRSPNSQGPNGTAGQEKLGTIGSGADSSNRPGDFSSQSHPQQHAHQSSQMMNKTFGGNEIVESPSSLQQQQQQQQPSGPQALEQMCDADKFGLPGLLAMMHHPSADLRSLTAQGQDLTSLGLDLTSSEPLHTQLGSVFNPNAHTRLPLDADYTLLACYRVANVQALHERIPSFSEETLFYIFYSSGKDLVQELVADELIGRKWRFHKGEKMWVTRDENYPAPVEVEREISEQGFYIWWDWKGWKKVRRQYILRYEDLDNGATRNGSALNQMALSAAPSAIAQVAGVFNR